jgi:hypothetical protein
LTLNNDPEFVNVELIDFIAEFSGIENWNGSDTVSFLLSDGFLSDSADVIINVIAVGDEPQLNLPNSFSLDEDSSEEIDFTEYIQNIENYELTLEVSGNIHLEIEISDYRVSFIPEQNWNGNEEVEFHLLNMQEEIDVIDNVTVQVMAVNDAPVIYLPMILYGFEDEVITLDLADYSSDIDNIELDYTAYSEELEYQLAGSEITIWLPENEYGDGNIRLGVSDGNIVIVDTLEVSIAGVNDAPWLSLPSECSFAEDTILGIDLAQSSLYQ